MAGPYNGEIKLIVSPQEETEVGVRIPLSVKMISSAGEIEVIMYVRIDKETDSQNEPKKRTEEEPALVLPQLTRVVKENPAEGEATWVDVDMDAESIVKLTIGSNGEVEEIQINMDSNTVKKLINAKGANIEMVRNKYLTAVYSHSLMVYTTLYGYYKKEEEEENIDENIVKQIEDDLNEAVQFSFKYYTNFLMSFDEFTD